MSAAEEKLRYEQHNNDVDDPRYQAFVQPLVDVVSEHAVAGARGLDFGAGTGPVLAKLLRESGYDVALYDPFFWPQREHLTTKYDFVVASEVVEHLHSPRKEFSLLKSVLEPGGFLGVMTLLYDESVNFDRWFYRLDPTHVCFYTRQTFEWIAGEFGFSPPRFYGERTLLLKC